jgi:hypothetical protein
MHNLLGRIRKLEGRVDESGHVPDSDAWYTFWANQACRAIRREKIDLRIPYRVIDRARRNAELARQAQGANVATRDRRAEIASDMYS